MYHRQSATCKLTGFELTFTYNRLKAFDFTNIQTNPSHLRYCSQPHQNEESRQRIPL